MTQDEINCKHASDIASNIDQLVAACQNLATTLSKADITEALSAGDYLINAKYHLKRIADGYHQKKEQRGSSPGGGQAAGGEDVSSDPAAS